jgi:hypothetical protein
MSGREGGVNGAMKSDSSRSEYEARVYPWARDRISAGPVTCRAPGIGAGISLETAWDMYSRPAHDQPSSTSLNPATTLPEKLVARMSVARGGGHR